MLTPIHRIDLGEVHLAVSHDGTTTTILNGGYIRSLRRYQNKLKGKRDAYIERKKKGSQRRRRAIQGKKRRLAKVARQLKDALHKLTTKLVSTLHQRGVQTVVIFVDELNKYAPAGGQGGLRDTLVDIAARGRHLNVVSAGSGNDEIHALNPGRDVIRCDMSKDQAGDACASTAENKGLCTSDQASVLTCRDGVLVHTSDCKTCAVSGDQVVCQP